VEKILTGRVRRGSGTTGLGGGAAGVAPVVIGPLCGSDALNWRRSRAFGAGFGIGTVRAGTVCAGAAGAGTGCALPDVATDSVTTAAREAAIKNASPARVPGATCSGIGSFGFLCNALPYPAFGHFIVLSTKGDMVFP
jgi:hypothetical protein